MEDERSEGNSEMSRFRGAPITSLGCHAINLPPDRGCLLTKGHLVTKGQRIGNYLPAGPDLLGKCRVAESADDSAHDREFYGPKPLARAEDC